MSRVPEVPGKEHKWRKLYEEKRHDNEKADDPLTAEYSAVVARNMPRLEGEAMQYWVETKQRRELRQVLAKGLVPSPISAEPRLAFETPITLPAIEKVIDFYEFYRARSGLYV